MRVIDNIPNTFVDENGEIIFVDEVEWDAIDLIFRDRCERIVNKIESKYSSSSITEMMKRNITKKEMNAYINAKHDLITIFLID